MGPVASLLQSVGKRSILVGVSRRATGRQVTACYLSAVLRRRGRVDRCLVCRSRMKTSSILLASLLLDNIRASSGRSAAHKPALLRRPDRFDSRRRTRHPAFCLHQLGIGHQASIGLGATLPVHGFNGAFPCINRRKSSSRSRGRCWYFMVLGMETLRSALYGYSPAAERQRKAFQDSSDACSAVRLSMPSISRIATRGKDVLLAFLSRIGFR